MKQSKEERKILCQQRFSSALEHADMALYLLVGICESADMEERRTRDFWAIDDWAIQLSKIVHGEEDRPGMKHLGVIVRRRVKQQIAAGKRKIKRKTR